MYSLMAEWLSRNAHLIEEANLDEIAGPDDTGQRAKDMRDPSKWESVHAPVLASEYPEFCGMPENFAFASLPQGKTTADVKLVHSYALDMTTYGERLVYVIFQMEDGSIIVGENIGD
jgi:hypothetical protein